MSHRRKHDKAFTMFLLTLHKANQNRHAGAGAGDKGQEMEGHEMTE